MAARQPSSGSGHQAWQQFVAVLEAERDALVANDGERVAALAAQKVDLAQALVGSALGDPELLGLARQARALNQVNSGLLQQRLAQTQQALALLRPASASGAAAGTGVYGRDGRAAQAPAGRGLSVA
jgi:flagellar biosynthesis/type III secretory pathway chaperone